MSEQISENIILGRVQGILPRNEQLTPGQLNHHVHVVGASGYGKTVLLSHIIKHKIATNQGLLFIDLKNDMETLLRFTKCAAQANRINDLQIFSLSDKKLSLPYNLISEGTATQLRDRIMLSLNWSEEFYKNQSSSFLLKLLIGLCYLRDHQGLIFTLGEILRASSDNNYVAQLALKIKDTDGIKPKMMLEECFTFLKDNGNYNSLQGLRTQLESLVLSDFGDQITSLNEGINLYETVNQKKITFIFLDSRRYGETAKTVGKFILQDLKAVSARIDAEVPEIQRKPYTVVIDEFSDLATEDFIGFLDRARSSKMSAVISHQELADLERISPEFAGRLMGNTSTLYAFLQKNPKSAETISGMAGTRTVWKSTRQTERLMFFEVDSGKGSKREVEEFIIHPNTIKTLKVGYCVAVKKYPKSKAHLVKVHK